MSPPIIYIAGPYRSKYGIFGRILNIYRARRLARRVWAAGFYALCPHLNSALMDGAAPDQQFLDGDIELLRGCDAILMMNGWEKSFGSIGELKYARERGMGTIYEIDATGTNEKIRNTINRIISETKGKKQ